MPCEASRSGWLAGFPVSRDLARRRERGIFRTTVNSSASDPNNRFVSTGARSRKRADSKRIARTVPWIGVCSLSSATIPSPTSTFWGTRPRWKAG